MCQAASLPEKSLSYSFQPGMESLRGAQELEGQLLTARIKHSWNTSVSPHPWLGILLAFGLVRALDLRDDLPIFSSHFQKVLSSVDAL